MSLVGAGPGDPGLITAAGLGRLRRADVVVYDALVNPVLLSEAPEHAERIDAGKRGGQHKLTQEQINELLVKKAGESKYVVRLKGGDPYLFGRGAEEAIHLAEHGVACEVIPGVTAGIAAPAAAGIPVTHRELASTVTFVTGHEDPTKDASAIDYHALAKLITAGGTVCFYMGVARLPEIVDHLAACGLAPTIPAAAIQWGTLPTQRSVRGRLDTLAELVRTGGIASPAIIVVGSVAGVDPTGLDFFTARPLFGQRIVITRSRQQASVLRQRLAELGAEVLEAPTIELMEPESWTEVDQAIRDIKQYDWLILTSTNGVEALASRLNVLGLDARHFTSAKVAVIGDATGEALHERVGLRADLVPRRFVAESLASELIEQHDVAGKKLLMLRVDIARPALPALLTEVGADVTELVVYQTKLAAALPDQVVAALREKRVGWVTFASSSTVRNMVELLGQERDLLSHTRIASIGPITSQTVRELGYEVAVEAELSTIPGLVDAICSA